MSEVRRPLTLRQILELHERVVIIRAIQQCGGCRAEAARVLGIRREYLYARVRKLGIDLDEVDASMRKAVSS